MPNLAASLRDAARAAFRVDRSKVALDVGLRSALGVAITLGVGWASGHTIAGVTATIGALSGGFVSHQGTYRTRVAVIVVATLSMAACAFAGATVGYRLGPDIAATAVVAFGAGMLVSLGPSATVVGIQAVVGLVVFSQFHLPVLVALRDAGLVVLGGVVQVVLVVVLWPLRRFPAERRALQTAFAGLADYCQAARQGEAQLMDAAPFNALAAALRDSQPFGGEEAAAHAALGAQVDRLRLELVGLVRARSRLEQAGAADRVVALDTMLDASAQVLAEEGAALAEGRMPVLTGPDRDRFRAALAGLRAGSDADEDVWVHAAAVDARRRGEAVAGQLRTVARLAAVPAGGDPEAVEEVALTGHRPPHPSRRRRSVHWASERAATLRSNLTFSSQAFRHATRLAVTLAVAVGVSHIFSAAHRYWLPLTAMLVLRPDLISTVTRGLSRVFGTLLGAGLVTVVIAELKPGPGWLIVTVVALCGAATALVLANYAVFSVFIASLVVTLLAFTGAPELATAGDRSLYTAIGAVLAFVAYAVWPTWESTSLPDTLSALVATEARYARDVLTAWADPVTADRPALEQSRLDARLARSNAEASVARWAAEPERTPSRTSPLEADAVSGFMAAVRSAVQALLALHAELPDRGPAHPEVNRLAEQAHEALRSISDRVQGSAVSRPLPPLRSEHLALTAALGLAGSDRPGGSDPAGAPADAGALLLASETDLLVNSINTLGHLVGLQEV